jgi:hypothetical protein
VTFNQAQFFCHLMRTLQNDALLSQISRASFPRSTKNRSITNLTEVDGRKILLMGILRGILFFNLRAYAQSDDLRMLLLGVQMFICTHSVESEKKTWV